MSFRYHRTYRGPLKAVVLDWAGTTVDYGSLAPAIVFVEIFEAKGVPITIEEARQPMGKQKRDHIEYITKLPRIADRWQEVFHHLPTQADVDELYEKFIPRQLEVLADYAALIPGVLEAQSSFGKAGLKIGSNTGYNRQMTDLLLKLAKKQGYEPDATVCATEFPTGRPAPWMVFALSQQLGVYPMEAMLKIGDTIVDIEEGLNAGMWTVGVAKTGNGLGMSEKDVQELDAVTLKNRLRRVYEEMYRAGAHFVVDGIGDVPPLIEQINKLLAMGVKP